MFYDKQWRRFRRMLTATIITARQRQLLQLRQLIIVLRDLLRAINFMASRGMLTGTAAA